MDPQEAKVQLYQYKVEQHAKQWWIRGWLKTQDVVGDVTLRVKYSYGKDAEDVFNLGGKGSQEWKHFSVITTALQVRDSTDVVFEIDGAGQAWLDDVAISALLSAGTPDITAGPRRP